MGKIFKEGIPTLSAGKKEFKQTDYEDLSSVPTKIKKKKAAEMDLGMGGKKILLEKDENDPVVREVQRREAEEEKRGIENRSLGSPFAKVKEALSQARMLGEIEEGDFKRHEFSLALLKAAIVEITKDIDEYKGKELDDLLKELSSDKVINRIAEAYVPSAVKETLEELEKLTNKMGEPGQKYFEDIKGKLDKAVAVVEEKRRSSGSSDSYRGVGRIRHRSPTPHLG